MKRSLACLGAMFLFSACVVHETSGQPAPVATTPPPATAPATTVAAPTTPPPGTIIYGHHPVPLVTGANAFGGPTGPIRGWVYFIQETKSFPDLAGKTPNAALATAGFNVANQTPSGGFPGIDPNRNSWFAVRYEGRFDVGAAGTWGFQLTSDDGGNLYVDGNIVVQDDGLHPGTVKTGQLTLNPGRHELRIDYFQGGGNVQLQLAVTPPNGAQRAFAERM
jgi:hypothetical protein